MTSIAELGIRIGSGDTTQAATDLDKVVDAGKRSSESAGRAGRAWETALAGIQGDTRSVVNDPITNQCGDGVSAARCSGHARVAG